MGWGGSTKTLPTLQIRVPKPCHPSREIISPPGCNTHLLMCCRWPRRRHGWGPAASSGEFDELRPAATGWRLGPSSQLPLWYCLLRPVSGLSDRWTLFKVLPLARPSHGIEQTIIMNSFKSPVTCQNCSSNTKGLA